MSKFGVDLSTWQSGVDYAKAVKEGGVTFALLRAGFGRHAGQKDNQFETHYAGFAKQGIPMGAYHYSYAVSVEEAKQEAAFFLECVKGKSFSLPVYYDMEESRQAACGKRLCTDMAKAWCEAVQAGGYPLVGIYTNPNWLENYLHPQELFPRFELWCASWGKTQPAYEGVGVWQFGGEVNLLRSTRVAGIGGAVDQNYLLRDYLSNAAPKPPAAQKPEQPKAVRSDCLVTGNGVRLRAEAHTGAAVLAVLNKGDKVEWFTDDAWGWSRVQRCKTTGWMSNRYLEKAGLSRYRTGTNQGHYVNLREKPSIDGRVLRQLQPGDTFEVVCILPSRWLHIERGGMQSYLFYDKSYITLACEALFA